MEVTNNYGRVQTCVALNCNSKDILSYRTHTPPFANAIDSIYVCWCKDHEKEGKDYLASLEGSKDRINQASSNS